MANSIMIIDDSVRLGPVVGIAYTAAGDEVIEACDDRDALTKGSGAKINLMMWGVNMPSGMMLEKFSTRAGLDRFFPYGVPCPGFRARYGYIDGWR